MRKEFKIGLVGIAVLVILYCGINYLKGINLFKPESYYLVEFTDINGLSKSSPVFANGYQIGIVRDIHYNYEKPGHVIVGIETEEEMKIPKGSYAELISEMLGTIKMNLILNNGCHEYISENDTIAGSANAGLLGAAEKNLLPQVETMLPKLDSILASLNALLADPALTNTLHNAEQITCSLQKSSEQLNKLMCTDLPQIASNASAITSNLKSVSDNLKEINYASTFAQIDSTLQNVHLLTEKMTRKDNSIGLLLNDTSLYYKLTLTSSNAADLLEDLKSHPKRYVHFSLFGKKDK